MACSSGFKERWTLEPSSSLSLESRFRQAVRNRGSRVQVVPRRRGSATHKGLRVRAAVATGDEFLHHPNDFGFYKRREAEESPGELLSQVRKWKKEARQLRAEEGQEVPVWNSWIKKRVLEKKHPEEWEARQLTKKVVKLSKRRQLEKIFALIENEKKKNKSINLITMNAVLAACVNCGEVDKAFELYQRMTKSNGIGADNITYGTLLKGLGQAKRLDDAFELLEQMEKKKCPGNYSLSEVHLNTLVNACAEAGDALRARSVFIRYKSFSKGVNPSTFTYNLLLKGYSRSENPLEALKVFEEMKLLNLEIERLTYNSVIFACIRGKDLECAMDLLEDMKEEAQRLNNPNLLPDVVTYTTLLQGLAEEKDLDGLLRIVQEMKEMESCKIDRVAYTAIIDAFIVAGSPEEGLKTLKEMEEKSEENPKLCPRPHVFLALLRSFSSEGNFEMCKVLCMRMINQKSSLVFMDDKIKALQFVFESAVVSQHYTEARQILSFIVCHKDASLDMSERMTQSLVKLMVISDFSMNKYQPIIIPENISLKSTISSFMVEKNKVPNAYEKQTLSNVIGLFETWDIVTVMDEEDNYVGIAYARDCIDLSSTIGEIMKPFPLKLSVHASVKSAMDMFFELQTEILPVVNDRGNAYLPRHYSSSFHQSNNKTTMKDVEEIDWNDKIFKPVIGFIFLSDLISNEQPSPFASTPPPSIESLLMPSEE